MPGSYLQGLYNLPKIIKADNWLELFEKAFNFIGNLREEFNRDSIEVKKNILMVLGKKFTFLNGKLTIEYNDWLVPIRENYKALEEAYLGLELTEVEDFNLKNDVLETICSSWLGREDSNRLTNNILCHRLTFLYLFCKSS